MKWINTSLLVIMFSVLSQAQSGFELRFVNQEGISLGVEDNQYTRVDYKKGKHNLAWANTIYPAPIKEQFFNLSYMYSLDFGAVKLFPNISFASNLRTDNLQISTAYLMLPAMIEQGKLIAILSPGYDGFNELIWSGTLMYGSTLKFFVDYGKQQRFTTAQESISFGLTRFGERLNIKSGIQFPTQNGNFNARILTSFSYKL